jgi:glycosyltransferase involved in cell wall biosynthesis
VLRERLVLFFGRIEHYKGIDVLCRAMASLGEDVRLAIAGPGRLDKTTQDLVAQLGSRVELHNMFLDDASVAILMQRASVVALPYRHVTQSSIPGIAAAFGVRVVASSLGNFVEEVPALGGQLVPVEDPIALATALANILDAPAQELPQAPTFEQLAPAFVELYRSAALRQYHR